MGLVSNWGDGDVAHDKDVVFMILTSTDGVRSADMTPAIPGVVYKNGDGWWSEWLWEKLTVNYVGFRR